MDDAINAVLPDIETSLTGPLYFDRAKLNRDKPAPPYSLFDAVSEPADSPNRYRTQAAAIFGLTSWGTRAQLLVIRRNLEWLRVEVIGNYGTSQNLRYSLWTRTFTREEGWLINGTTEAWNLSTTYRVEYENLAAYV